MSALFSILNLKDESVVVPNIGVLFPGKGVTGISLNEVDVDEIVRRGLSIVSSDIALGPAGPPGPPAWGTATAWAINTVYTNVAPSSVVTYDGNTYVCIISHTSTSTFDGTKWLLIAARGLQGLTGIGQQGIQGIQGPPPWSQLQVWAANTAYTNIAPSSLVKYQNNIYICTTAHTSTSTFDTSKWILALPEGSQGPVGPPGPSAWAQPVNWGSGANYTSVAPASTVVYNFETYVCTTSHTSTSTFDSAKFFKVTYRGADGPQGNPGNIGNTGPNSWASPTAWATSTSYSNIAPASVVTYLGSAYVCTVAHTSTSTFDPTKFSLLVMRGNTILYGTTSPAAGDGINGDFYIYDRSGSNQSKVMYGPKSGGSWPNTFWIIQVYQIDDVPGLTAALQSINNNINTNSSNIASNTTAIAINTKQLLDIEFFGAFMGGRF